MVVPREPLPLPVGLLPQHCGTGATSCTRRRRSAARQLEHIDQWVREVGLALNWLDGRPVAEDFTGLNAVRQRGRANVRSDIVNLGTPTCSPTAAHRELCGFKPGYEEQPVTVAAFSPGKVALPSDAVKCYPGGILSGAA